MPFFRPAATTSASDNPVRRPNRPLRSTRRSRGCCPLRAPAVDLGDNPAKRRPASSPPPSVDEFALVHAVLAAADLAVMGSSIYHVVWQQGAAWLRSALAAGAGSRELNRPSRSVEHRPPARFRTSLEQEAKIWRNRRRRRCMDKGQHELGGWCDRVRRRRYRVPRRGQRR